ncbi:oligoribonuclease [Ectothiorhodospira haloalkaliphila]|uniref:Oligoribonuclease n=1 Tax=Ectothiorhodospira haloalkaliphila TaxID=421628 RepID=W8KSY3_9GAMM|nr:MULTISPECIES: oligoribonuclease [Ectothiorhodospira]AHK78661.1 oligoribonuclease [Ectothiorhodospira haloalkaliphila]MCG5493938.1 oligoribonuclease [Ectothiorhodospira variabilis]MCG5498152.1 oligoribonuclease [Ectothiorhodospira variabilis]MCG5503741.1 oligoribonuclease [Ectothiorhodospira variabilis]MCG5506897.1 oligoribonuclease [Ectothiorhodospira variabilis]
MSPHPDNLVWIDLEMTGLDPLSDYIIEIATIVTDKNLNILAEGPVIAIHQSEEILGGLDDWNHSTHSRSGLLQRVRGSMYNEVDAEQATLRFLREYVPARTSPMCGNTICQDRRFLHRCMPDLEAFFHYRNLDVSTLKELARRWAPEVLNSLSKDATHQALQDIRDSIAELRHYREHLLKV